MTMCVTNTPVEAVEPGLWVKREDLCCPRGPHFSKTRGVYARALTRPEPILGVLDTYHSQGGWAVAQAAKLTGKQCLLFYPVRKAERDAPLKIQQQRAKELGAELIALPAGRSAILFHQAKKQTEARGGYMYPNALKLKETVDETAREFARTDSKVLAQVRHIVISASSATIAAGVIHGAWESGWRGTIWLHMGYSRPESSVRRYLESMTLNPAVMETGIRVIDEGYAYGDLAKPGPKPPFPCNQYYDLKAYRWIKANPGMFDGEGVLLWNVG